jgi:hypothetical protein
MMLHYKASFKGKAGLIKSQSIRVLKNSSTEEAYNDTMKTLKEGLMSRGYPSKLIDENTIAYDQRPIYTDPEYRSNKKITLIKDKVPHN